MVSNIVKFVVSFIVHKYRFAKYGRRLGVSYSCILTHDLSKLRWSEFRGYVASIHLSALSTPAERFAWLHHIHRNPHHWEYWVLVQPTDTPADYHSGRIPLTMPEGYVREMVADRIASIPYGSCSEVIVDLNKDLIFMDLTSGTKARIGRVIKEIETWTKI